MQSSKFSITVLLIVFAFTCNCYADNNPEGTYLRPHTSADVCGDSCDPKKQSKDLPEGWEKSTVEDTLEISNYSDKKLTFKLFVISDNHSSCSLT